MQNTNPSLIMSNDSIIIVEIGVALYPLFLGESKTYNRIKEIIKEKKKNKYGIEIPEAQIIQSAPLTPSNRYRILIHGYEAAKGELKLNKFLAIRTSYATEEIDGEPTKDPITGREALWIEPENEKEARRGYILVTPERLLVNHLTIAIENHLDELLERQMVKNMIDLLEEYHPCLVAELKDKKIELSSIHQILKKMLSEKISISKLPMIIESIIDTGNLGIDEMYSIVREKLGKLIVNSIKNENEDGKIYVCEIKEIPILTYRDEYLSGLSPEEELEFIKNINEKVEDFRSTKRKAAFLTNDAQTRCAVAKLLKKYSISVPVVQRYELITQVNPEIIGRIE